MGKRVAIIDGVNHLSYSLKRAISDLFGDDNWEVIYKRNSPEIELEELRQYKYVIFNITHNSKKLHLLLSLCGEINRGKKKYPKPVNALYCNPTGKKRDAYWEFFFFGNKIKKQNINL